jgi:hypothetical protein
VSSQDGVAKRINNATLSRGGAPGRVPVVDPELRAYLDERFGAVDRRFDDADRRFDDADRRFDVVHRRFDAVDRRFDAVDARFDTVDARFDSIDQRFGAADQRIDGVDQRLDTVDRRFVALETEVRHSGVLIEQVRHEVQVVAEMVVANTEAITQLRRRLDAR